MTDLTIILVHIDSEKSLYIVQCLALKQLSKWDWNQEKGVKYKKIGIVEMRYGKLKYTIGNHGNNYLLKLNIFIIQ